MKTYTLMELLVLAENCDFTDLDSDLDAQYVLLDDLIAAGALVPVPVGGACQITKISICECFIYLGNVYRLYSFSPVEFGAWQLSDHSEHIFALDTIVQPVRLRPIAEVVKT